MGPPYAKTRVVDAKMQRQEALQDPERRFAFLLTETAIRARIVPRAVMAEQCAHLATVAELPNVEAAAIPFGVQFPAMPLNTFVVYDERFVTVELFSGEVLLHDPQDVAEHLSVFDLLSQAAIRGRVLDRREALRVTALEVCRHDLGCASSGVPGHAGRQQP